MNILKSILTHGIYVAGILILVFFGLYWIRASYEELSKLRKSWRENSKVKD